MEKATKKVFQYLLIIMIFIIIIGLVIVTQRDNGDSGDPIKSVKWFYGTDDSIDRTEAWLTIPLRARSVQFIDGNPCFDASRAHGSALFLGVRVAWIMTPVERNGRKEIDMIIHGLKVWTAPQNLSLFDQI